MTEPWRETTLGDLEIASEGAIQTGPFGSQLHMSDYSSIGTPVVMPTNIRGLRVDDADIARVSEEHVERLSRHQLQPGDIVYSRRGDVEKCALIRDRESGWLCGTGCLLVRVGGPQVDPRFLSYSLSQPETRAWITARAVGATMPNLNTGILREVPVLLPSLPEQRGIAATLGALDDKIESNRRVMELEFLLAVNVLTAGSTEPVRVGEVAAMTKGLSYKGSGLDDGSTPGAVEMINLANFTTSGQMKAEGVKHYTGEFKTTHRLSELDLIVANTDLTQDREILGRGFLLPPRHVGAIHTHHTSVVRFQDGKQWMTPFLWARLQSPDFRDRAKGFATGTTVTALPAETLLDFEFTVPLDPEMIAAQGNALIRHAWQLKDETECLSRTRDTLLPELLSGRIRVPEAEQAVAEVIA